MISVAVLMGTGAAAAQTVSWKGPISGLVYDSPSRSLRPLVGFPGASYLGAAILPDIEAASIAPDGEAAFVVQNGRAALVEGLRGGNQRRLTLPESIPQFERVAWASDSRAAVVYSSSARQVRRLERGDSGLAAGPAIDLSGVKGEVTSLAANEDASRIVIGVRDPDDGGLYAVGDGFLTRLVSLANPGPAAFARNGHTLYAVDRETKQLLRFSDPGSGGYEWLAFAGEEHALADPNGIIVSRDGRNLYVTGGADRVLRIYDLAARALLGEIALNAAPNRLAELPGTNSVFLLASREKSGQPIWILDARLAPTVFFVPAGE
jgi:hypothetical protein